MSGIGAGGIEARLRDRKRIDPIDVAADVGDDAGEFVVAVAGGQELRHVPR